MTFSGRLKGLPPSWGGHSILVEVNPEVADLLYEEERAGVEELEQKLKKKIVIKTRPGFHQEQFNIIEI